MGSECKGALVGRTVNGRRGGWRSLVLLDTEANPRHPPRPSAWPVSRPATGNHPLFSIFLSRSLYPPSPRVCIFHARPPLSLSLSLSLFLSSCPSPLVFFLLASRATPRASVYYLYNAWPGGAPALCSCTHKPLLLRSSGTRREYGE